MLEPLSPTERAVYVLREAFDYPHRRIAEVLGLSEANARQLVTRARRHIAGEPRWTVDAGEHERLVDAFVAAAQTAVTSPGSSTCSRRMSASMRLRVSVSRRSGVVRDHCLAPERVDAPLYGGRYRSLFEDLPPLRVDEDALHALGRPGGPCDLGADRRETPTPTIAAVWPFFGQFIAHDITADRSPLAHRADPARIRNFRVPQGQPRGRLRGRAGRRAVPVRARTTPPSCCFASGHDVPRNHEGIALIGDPAQRRRTCSRARCWWPSSGCTTGWSTGCATTASPSRDVFDEARRAATWHYQHVILREFLPGLIGAELTAELLEHGPRLYRVDGDPYIPFEFADAAYRYGHAQIRDRYQVNAHFGPCPVFPDLMGFGPVAPEHTVDWALQIDVEGHPPAQRAKRIDARLPAPLIALPTQISGAEPGTDYASLANRDLQRGQAVGLAVGRSRRAPPRRARR